MANNKVQLSDGTVLIDTSVVTVTPEVLANGYTALDKSGQLITGAARGWTLLGSQELTLYNITSTAAIPATTLSIGPAAWTSKKIIYVRVRDKAGKRAGYFYGSDAFFVNLYAARGATSNYTGSLKITHYCSDVSVWSQNVGTTGYGVFGYSITPDGVVNIYKRYNSTNSRTIDGTYVIEVYALDYPDGISPYDA